MLALTEYKTKEQILFNPDMIVAVVDKKAGCMIYTSGMKSTGNAGLNFRVSESYASVLKALQANELRKTSWTPRADRSAA